MKRLLFVDFEDLEFIHPILRNLLAWIQDNFGIRTVTSLYRMGDDGIHGTLPLRATDLRVHPCENGFKIEEKINENWQYDPKRPEMKVAIFHDVGQGWHLHLQIYKKTRRI